jgi:hypothetical protein
MVIRTEYRSQSYSMGSSDPLPVGFEIRFGILNFLATGNSYLMRITNHARTPPVAVDRARTGSRHAHCRRLSARPSGRWGPFSTTTPTTLRPALSPGADGTTSGHARRLTTGCTL